MSSSYRTPTNQVTITLNAEHLVAACTYAPQYKKLVHGDLTAAVEMAVTGQIPVGGAVACDGWSEDALASFKSVLDQVAQDIGYTRMPGSPRFLTHSDSATNLPRALAVRELCAILDCACTGPAHSSDFPWAVRRSVTFNDDETVTLTLSWQAAVNLSAAAEFYVRLGLGQLEYLSEAILHGEIHPASPQLKASSMDYGKVHICGDRLRGVKRLIGHAEAGSLGIGHPKVSETAHLAWELKKEVDQKQAVFRDPKPVFKGVNYDGNLLRYTKVALPVVEVTPSFGDMPQLEDGPALSGRITDRYLNFYFAIGNVSSSLPDEELDKQLDNNVYPFFRELAGLVGQRTDALPGRRFEAEDMLSCDRWEFTEPDSALEPIEGVMQSNLSFYLNREFGKEHLSQLVDVITKAIDELSAKRNVPVGRLSADVYYQFDGSTTFKLF